MSAELFGLEPRSDAIRRWYRIVRGVAALHEGGGHPQPAYIQQCLQHEANGQAAILPTPEELDLMLTNMDDPTRTFVIQSLVILQSRDILEYAIDLIASADVNFDFEDERESCGFQFTASQADDFLQTLARVEISTLQTDEAKCSICKLEYGKRRGGTTSSESASNSDQGLPGEDASEQPVKLSCGHIFGEWCMKTWLLEQPASCPTCRLQFEPIIQ